MDFLKRHIATIIIAAIVGLGSTVDMRVSPDSRPDPFTGSMGKDMENRIMSRIRELEAYRDSNSQISLNRTERIRASEIRIEAVEKRFDRIERKIDEIHHLLINRPPSGPYLGG